MHRPWSGSAFGIGRYNRCLLVQGVMPGAGVATVLFIVRVDVDCSEDAGVWLVLLSFGGGQQIALFF